MSATSEACTHYALHFHGKHKSKSRKWQKITDITVHFAQFEIQKGMTKFKADGKNSLKFMSSLQKVIEGAS